MKRPILLTLLLLSSILLSCNKEDTPSSIPTPSTLSVNGQLLNKVTQEPIGFVELLLKHSQAGTDPSIGTTTTNENGEFNFEIRRDFEFKQTIDNAPIYFDCFNERFQYWNWWVNGATEPVGDYLIEKGEVGDYYNIELYPMTYLQATFIDTGAIVPSDTYLKLENMYSTSSIGGGGGFSGIGDGGSDGPFSFHVIYNVDNQSTINFFGRCYRENIVDVYLGGLNVNNVMLQQIECVPGDTTTVVIKY